MLAGVARQARTPLTGGEREVEVAAENIRQLLRALGERCPDLKPHLGDGVAIAIDGEIFQDAWLEPHPARGRGARYPADRAGPV